MRVFWILSALTKKVVFKSTLLCGFVWAFLVTQQVWAGSFAPEAGQVGSTAVRFNSPYFVGWATGIDVVRGPEDISDSGGALASFGDPTWAFAQGGIQNFHVVSLGDGGSATMTFDRAITNRAGFDFAIFENGFIVGQSQDIDPEWWGLGYLELAFVEVSSDGQNFYRFDALSETQTTYQAQGIDATDIHNLAGKYTLGWGTPFDLEELSGIEGLDINQVTHVRIVDVVGSLDENDARYDALNRKINDPWPTAGSTSGFDLDAVGVIHAAPLPGAVWLLGSGLIGLVGSKWKIWQR